MNKRGRKESFKTPDSIEKALSGWADGSVKLSRYLLLRLQSMGYVEAESISKPTRGRPQKRYLLTEIGRKMVNPDA